MVKVWLLDNFSSRNRSSVEKVQSLTMVFKAFCISRSPCSVSRSQALPGVYPPQTRCRLTWERKKWMSGFSGQVIVKLSEFKKLIIFTMSPQFMPMSATGRASVRNSISILTASHTICKWLRWGNGGKEKLTKNQAMKNNDFRISTSRTRCLVGLFRRWRNMRQAKSVCRPSSLNISFAEQLLSWSLSI